MRRDVWYARQEFYRKLADVVVDAGGGSSSSGSCTLVGYNIDCEAETITPDGTTQTLYPFDPGDLLLMPMNDGANISFGTITGTMIGTTTTQLMAFWGATPVVQDTGWGCTNVTTTKGFDANATTLDEVADTLGTLIDQLKTYGLVGA